MSENNEIEIWAFEYELRQFIYLATRWQIKAAYSDRIGDRPYSIFTNYVNDALPNYGKFCTQLARKIAESRNPEFIKLDLNQRFLKGIYQYIDWHNEHLKEIEALEPNNPYNHMLNVIESTRDEILKYWPELKPDQNKPEPLSKQPSKISIDQLALKFVYEGRQITRENGNEIVKQIGYKSGEKLFQRYTYYTSAANRKGKPTPCTPKKLKNKIELIESIIDLLPTNKQESANDELLILKGIYDSEYQ